ncbi:MAG: hypothetical protein HYR60_26035 [Acidobacteria bacterium]|nr:hypothetical protein [Acidobacteriota bacterium]
MELARQQAWLARLSTDAGLRERLPAGPPAAGEEAAWLAGLSARQVEAFAETLLRKRRSAVRGLLPQSTRSLGPRFGELFRAHAARRGHLAPFDDARAFAEFLAVQPGPIAAIARREGAALRRGRVLQAARLLLDKPAQLLRDLVAHTAKDG